jgi:hypothetical protein
MRDTTQHAAATMAMLQDVNMIFNMLPVGEWANYATTGAGNRQQIWQEAFRMYTRV